MIPHGINGPYAPAIFLANILERHGNGDRVIDGVPVTAGQLAAIGQRYLFCISNHTDPSRRPSSSKEELSVLIGLEEALRKCGFATDIHCGQLGVALRYQPGRLPLHYLLVVTHEGDSLRVVSHSWNNGEVTEESVFRANDFSGVVGLARETRCRPGVICDE